MRNPESRGQVGFFRVIINGTSPAPGEVWSVGLSFVGPNTLIPFLDLKDWATQIATGMSALSGNTCINFLSAGGAVTMIRTEQRGETDDLLIQAAESSLATPKVGAGTANKTLQTSVCFSLITAQPGRSYRGRCYWPAWGYTPTASLQFSSGDLTALLTSFEDIVQMIGEKSVIVDPAYQMLLGVRSKLLHETNDVGQIAVGSVPDTQRRRRDAIPEVYSTLTL